MSGKRAYQQELREKKIINLKAEIKELYDRFMADPLNVDFGEEWDRLAKKHEKDKGLLLIAERDFYSELKKTKELKTNM